MARHGVARHGVARQGVARQGEAGMVRVCMISHFVVDKGLKEVYVLN